MHSLFPLHLSLLSLLLSLFLLPSHLPAQPPTPPPAADTAALPAGLVAPENLLAWCIVPYDSPPREPAARLAMLRRLGLTQYIWDWRPEHLASLPAELALAREAGIRVRGVWLWLDAQNDAPGRLGPSNRAVLDAVFAAGLRCEFWVGFNANVFASAPDDAARVAVGVAHLAPLLAELRRHGGTLGLYNHGDWFGEPPNQLRILAALGDPADAGLVYNFHHAHDQLDRFNSFLPAMVPRLLAVNVSGVRPGGPKILPVGEGTHELAMLHALVAHGYRGPLGVLGHVENTDVEPVLARNLAGLRTLASRASEWINLFNGRDLTGWSLAVEGAPVGQDPKGHIVVRDGAIHMYADTPTDARGDYGVVVTDKKFSRYHLTFEYAWGPKKLAPRVDKLKDAGLLYHIANPDERTWGIWPVSIECQIQEGDTADLVFLKTSALTWLHPQPGTAPEGQGHPGLLPEFGGLPERCTQQHHFYVGRFPVYDTLEGWNRVDVIVHADETAVHLVNGQVRSRLAQITDHTGAPLASGHIALQLEAAEVRYRDLRLRELPEPLRASASSLTFTPSPNSRTIPSQTLTITNPGPKPVPLTIELIGRDPARFTVTPAPGAPAELAPGASAQLTVGRAPAVNAASSGPAHAALQIGPLDLGVLVLLQAP